MTPQVSSYKASPGVGFTSWSWSVAQRKEHIKLVAARDNTKASNKASHNMLWRGRSQRGSTERRSSPGSPPQLSVTRDCPRFQSLNIALKPRQSLGVSGCTIADNPAEEGQEAGEWLTSQPLELSTTAEGVSGLERETADRVADAPCLGTWCIFTSPSSHRECPSFCPHPRCLWGPLTSLASVNGAWKGPPLRPRLPPPSAPYPRDQLGSFSDMWQDVGSRLVKSTFTVSHNEVFGVKWH